MCITADKSVPSQDLLSAHEKKEREPRSVTENTVETGVRVFHWHLRVRSGGGRGLGSF